MASRTCGAPRVERVEDACELLFVVPPSIVLDEKFHLAAVGNKHHMNLLRVGMFAHVHDGFACGAVDLSARVLAHWFRESDFERHLNLRFGTRGAGQFGDGCAEASVGGEFKLQSP